MNTKEITKVCRTCLEELTNSNFLSINDSTNNVKDELIQCIPELDLALVPDAFICVFCASALHAAYCFKQKCLQTENKIRIHLERNACFDLVQIKKEMEANPKFDVVHGIGIGMEVIYIKDDDDDTVEDDSAAPAVEIQSSVISKEDMVNSFLKYENEEIIPDKLPEVTNAINVNKPEKSNVKRANFIKKKKKFKKEQKYKQPTNSIKSSNDASKKSNDITIRKYFTRNSGVVQNNGQKTFGCRFCKYTTFNKHKYTVHLETHADEKPHACSSCDYRTVYKQCLENHLKQCQPTGMKQGKFYKCTLCTFVSSQKQFLKQHLATHNTEETLKCTLCTYEATNLSVFKRHLTSHTDEHQYKCKHCEYDCSDITTLNKHVMTHRIKKLHNCKLCKYSTDYQTSIANHILTHTGERRYSCTECDYKAIQKVNLVKHMKQHKHVKPFHCTECNYSVGNKFHLKRHMLFHEKKR